MQTVLTDEEYVKGSDVFSKKRLLQYGTVLCAALIQFVLFGMTNNISSIKHHWYERYNTKNLFLEQAGSVNFGSLFFFSVLAFYFIDKIGPSRTYSLGCFLVSSSLTVMALFPFPAVIFIFYGLILGIGASLILFSILFILKEIFPKKLSIANGIVSCGSCVGTLVQSQFINIFCDSFGWKTLFQSYSIIFVLMMLFGFVFHLTYVQKQKPSQGQSKSKSEVSAFGFVMRNHGFVTFCMSCFVFCLGYMDAYSETKSVDPFRSRTLIGYFSIGSLFGRLTMGFLANLVGYHRVHLLSMCFFSMGVLNVVSNLCNSFPSFVFYCITIGYFDGGYIALVFPTICDMIRRHFRFEPGTKIPDVTQQENVATSICYISQGVSLVLGPILINCYMPFIGTYSNLFTMSGIVFMTSAMILSLAPLF
ncbi:Monocarboxylate transporter 8 [Thelohanellus kitauei]|uniref:Monocarboxylate transporter 8 n=1 Tax=Thelohanellus kitauei TaxID=669202 RepID=A0A0C2J0Y5_THEKT|nr:Monocarboxylate transporter 8 [Thelohanellus kitauei]